MIKYNSSLEICQLDMLKRCEEIKNLLNSVEQEFLESVNKEDFPLAFAPNLYYLHERVSILLKSIENISEKIKEIG